MNGDVPVYLHVTCCVMFVFHHFSHFIFHCLFYTKSDYLKLLNSSVYLFCSGLKQVHCSALGVAVVLHFAT